MSDALILDRGLDSARNLAWWLYLGHAASFLFSLGTLSFIPLIINYVRRPDTAGTFIYSHHTWQIRSFWWYLAWMLVGGMAFMTFVGIPLALLTWGCAWLWKAYRLIKGLIDLNANRAMPV